MTYDHETGLARVITNGTSVKARHLERTPGPVAACQVDRARWSTIEGTGRVSRDPADVAEAVRRYAERYRQPRPNNERVAVIIEVTRILGSARLTPR